MAGDPESERDLPAEGPSVSTRNAAIPAESAATGALDQSVVMLAESLMTHNHTPEERAVIVEAGLRGQQVLLDEIRRIKIAATPDRPLASAGLEPLVGRPINDLSSIDPPHEEIREMEAAVRNFGISLACERHEPERHAALVEIFLQTNHEALEELEVMRRELAAKSPKAPATDTSNHTVPEDDNARVSPNGAEIIRIQRDLAEIDPEERAIYLETHSHVLLDLIKLEEQQLSLPPDPNLPLNPTETSKPTRK